MVRYSTDVCVLFWPVAAAKASWMLLVEPPNRGRKVALPLVDEGAPQVDSASQAGNGWLLRQGHTVAWIGWQGDVRLDGTGQKSAWRCRSPGPPAVPSWD